MNTHSLKSLVYSAFRIGSVAFFGALFLVGAHGTAFAAQSPQAANSGISPNLSRNWSGYVAQNSGSQNNTYSSVTGTWIVPNVTTSTSAAADATWVGIGGMNTSDLIQAGTQTITENGQILYQAWYEVLPNVSIPVSSLTVKPGDSITTTLTNQGNVAGENSQNWLISIVDNTTGQQYQTTVTYDSSESSAEWIEEMPATTQGYIALDNFGSVPFTQATAVMNGVSENLTELGAQALTMSNGQSVLSTPSSIGNDRESFIVTRSNASSDIAPEIIPISRGGFIRGPHGDQGFSYASSTTQSYGNGGQITRSFRYFVIPAGGTGTTTQVSSNGQVISAQSNGQSGNFPGIQYSYGNGTLSIQWSF